MSTLVVSLLSVLAVGTTVLIHYEMLRYAARLAERMHQPRRAQIVATIITILFAHILEISFYALVYLAMDNRWELGSLQGTFDGSLQDYFYFSISSFTTLGVGDVAPVGPIRILTGIEALNGLVLIAWSASFTYYSIQRMWDKS